MLGWFKKKFTKKEDDTGQSPADLKIPVAPRDFTTGQPQEPEKVVPSSEEDSAAIDSRPVASESLKSRTEIDNDTEFEELVAKTDEDLEDVVITPGPLETKPEGEPEILAPPEPDVVEAIRIEESKTDPTLRVDSTHEGEIDQTTGPLSEEKPAPQSGQDKQTEIKTTRRAYIPPKPAVADPLLKIPVAQKIAPSPEEQPKPVVKSKPLLARLTERLSRTRESFTYQLDSLFLGKKEIDAKLLDDLEELLITADLGVNITQEILDHARRKVKRKELSDPNSLKQVIKNKLKSFIVDYQQDATLVMPDEGPFVIMVVGVNGVGKTTTIGKIAHKFLQSGQSVLLVAADTFRAAAVSQLKIWGERNNIQVISKDEGSDPSAVVYDGLAHAKAKGYDVVLVDTAGRLHTQANLMEELKKIKRVMVKQLDGAPHEVMLVIDATTGQNGISQAKLFNEAVGLTGITLTKLDGTAKGGIVANICKELKTPIRFIGVGEKLEDLRDFDPDEFIEALFQSNTEQPK